MNDVLQEPSATAVQSSRSGSTLYVSSSLDTWTTDQPEMFARDVQIDDTGYRRLDPTYYSWLRSRMALAKKAAIAGRLPPDGFENLRVRFNAVHEWAVEYFGESRLLDAIRNLDARDYEPPVPEPDTPRRAPRGAEGVPAAALALVDAIRNQALALGWTHDRLYRVPEARGTGIAVSGGLVCYLRDGWRIGEVTRQFIETIGPPPLAVRQCFYNPDVDQPWIIRRDRNENISGAAGQPPHCARI